MSDRSRRVGGCLPTRTPKRHIANEGYERQKRSGSFDCSVTDLFRNQLRNARNIFKDARQGTRLEHGCAVALSCGVSQLGRWHR